jgi:heat shock protein HslJ
MKAWLTKTRFTKIRLMKTKFMKTRFMKIRPMTRTLTTAARLLSTLFAVAHIAGWAGSGGVEEPATEPAIQPAAKAAPTAADLVNSNWTAVSILGKPASAATSTLDIRAENQVGGNTGCNQFNGGVTLDDQHMEFGLLATTRMFCTPPINGQETVYLEALSLTRTWELTGGTLELLDESNAVVLRLEPAKD